MLNEAARDEVRKCKFLGVNKLLHPEYRLSSVGRITGLHDDAEEYQSIAIGQGTHLGNNPHMLIERSS